MLTLTIALVVFFVMQVRHKYATRYDERIQGHKEDIFEILSEHDPQRAQYDAYEQYKAEALEEKAYWASEWDALEPGTVIGKRRGASFRYTGYPKVIQENLERINTKVNYGFIKKRTSIVLDRLNAQGSVVDSLSLDPGSQIAQQLTALITQHDEVVHQRDTDPQVLNKFWIFVTSLSPLFMLGYAIVLFEPPALFRNLWSE